MLTSRDETEKKIYVNALLREHVLLVVIRKEGRYDERKKIISTTEKEEEKKSFARLDSCVVH